jgi:hypothetical protein
MRTFVIVLLTAAVALAEPVSIYRPNPHYFHYKGKPLVLITSDHHYGAVIDRDFDFARYLDYLASSGMNLTRIYPGAMFEPPDKYIPGNPLGPLPGRHILPGRDRIKPVPTPLSPNRGSPHTSLISTAGIPAISPG